MLRLTRTRQRSDLAVLKAEGRIVGEWVSLLEEECLALAEGGRRVVLDLGEVSYLDQRAVRVLRDLADRRVSLINCSPLVEELLAEDVA